MGISRAGSKASIPRSRACRWGVGEKKLGPKVVDKGE